MRSQQLVKNGIDNPEKLEALLKGQRLALISGPTGLNSELRSTAGLLKERFSLVKIFAPEHGLRGEVQAGDRVENTLDPETGLYVYSLYRGHSGRSMTEEQLEGIDTVVFDMQDVGARFYTYLYTLTEAMLSCAESRVKVVVLDHVNPLGCETIEGSLLDERFSSFVGKYAIPTRFGMTIGEFASYINREKSINCELEIVPCVHYQRRFHFADTGLCWVLPSPNVPNPETALAFVGTCLFEGTNLSEGRGTVKPFQFVGAPWLNAPEVTARMNKLGLDGVKFGCVYFKPTFSKHQNQSCAGVQMHITDPMAFESFRTGLHLLQTIRETHDEFAFLPPYGEGRSPFIAYLLGSDAILADDFSPEAFIASQKPLLAEFRKKSMPYFMYE